MKTHATAYETAKESPSLERGEYVKATTQSRANRYGWITVGVCATLHLMVLWYNFQRVPLTYGYDWPGHFTYLFYVAEQWRVPDASITPQFFNPPFYYFSIAAFSRLFQIPLVQAGLLFNQVLATLSLGVLIAIARRVFFARWELTLLFLSLYIANPTVYRSFGMMRPEPFLILIFAVAFWLLLDASQQEPRQWSRFVIILAIVAAMAAGVRQWGVFLQLGLFLWLMFRLWPQKGDGWHRFLRLLFLQGIVFTLLFVLVYIVMRGGGVLDFNAASHAFEAEFLTRLEIGRLFSSPIRPHLNYRFWPTLYADYWGDYWLYWRESHGHNGAVVSSARQKMLMFAMYGALVPSGLLLRGIWLQRPRVNQLTKPSIHTFVWFVLSITLVGYLLFAARYAEIGKGDTVKSVYLVYLVPFCAWMITSVVAGWEQGKQRLAIVIVLVGLIPISVNAIYLPVPQMFSRTWEQPLIANPLDEQLGDAYTLVGYEVESAENEQSIKLIWRADDYTGKRYKVFVHAFDNDGILLAQSDTIPAQWLRPTESWMLGEYVTDVHLLEVSAELFPAQIKFHVGFYDETTGQRLLTEGQIDHIVLTP